MKMTDWQISKGVEDLNERKLREYLDERAKERRKDEEDREGEKENGE